MRTPDLKNHMANASANMRTATRVGNRMMALLKKDEWTDDQREEYEALVVRLKDLTQSVANDAGRIAQAVDFE